MLMLQKRHLAHSRQVPGRFGESVIVDLTSGMTFPALDVAPKRERIQAATISPPSAQ